MASKRRNQGGRDKTPSGHGISGPVTTLSSESFIATYLAGTPLSVESINASRATPEEILGDLSISERELVMKVLRKEGACDKSSLEEFLSLDAGTRELRIRNIILSEWTDGAWKKAVTDGQVDGGKFTSRSEILYAAISSSKDTAGSIYSSCELNKPTPEEMLKALQPSELTANQKHFISLTPKRTPGEITTQDILEFKKWISGLDEKKRQNLWRASKPNAFTMASIIHKVRFSDTLDFTSDEFTLIQKLTKKTLPQRQDLVELKSGFLNGFKKDDEWVTLANLHKSIWKDISEGLFSTAQACIEYNTLLEFLGLQVQSVQVSLHPERGISKASANLEGRHPNNEDTYTSIDMQKNGATSRLDITFDGISGPTGDTGGYIASGIAKETIEVAALAGWIQSAEDVRFGLILADIIINLEKIQYGFRRMGTTATASLIEGENFHCIHSGDGGCKVLDNDKIIFSLLPHTLGGGLLSGLGIGPNPICINNDTGRNYKPIKLKKGFLIINTTDKLTDTLCDHEYYLALNDIEDPVAAMEKLSNLSSPRIERSKTYNPLCSCEPIAGKDDDMTFTVHIVK